MEEIIEAQVIDAHHLELKRPLPIAPGSIVVITIDTTKIVAENQDWYLLSSQGLEAAYNELEPDYSTDRIKQCN